MSAFRLSDAALCDSLDCNTVFDMTQARACPGCGSEEYGPIEAFLVARQGAANPLRELEAAGAIRAWKIVAVKPTEKERRHATG